MGGIAERSVVRAVSGIVLVENNAADGNPILFVRRIVINSGLYLDPGDLAVPDGAVLERIGKFAPGDMPVAQGIERDGFSRHTLGRIDPGSQDSLDSLDVIGQLNGLSGGIQCDEISGQYLFAAGNRVISSLQGYAKLSGLQVIYHGIPAGREFRVIKLRSHNLVIIGTIGGLICGVHGRRA